MKSTLFLFLSFTLGLLSAHAADEHVLRIGYQKSGAFLLVKSEGTLEKRLAPLGWQVQWVEFVAGVPLLEALGAGKLDLGHSGDAPVIFAQVANSPIVYLAASRPSPKSVGLAVPKDSPLRNVAELKGKRVIVGKGSSARFFLVRALANGGLQPSDITPVYLNPSDARAAFERGEGDAWAVWDPYLAAAEISSQARVLKNGEGATPFREFYLAHRDFAQNHGAVIAEVLAELEAVGTRAKQDPKRIAAFLSPQLKIDLPTLEKSEERKFRYGALPLTPEIVAEQQSVADLFYRLQLIPTGVQVKDAVWKNTP